jgi:hypothetical protein
MGIVQFGQYHHVQRGPWWLVCFALAAISFTVSYDLPVPALKITLSVAGVILLLSGVSLGHLVVEDEGDRLFIHFGPLPLFRKRIRYDDIREVDKGRVPFHESGGIQWSPWGGWIWSVWGHDCIILRLRRGTFRVGTDDAEGLAGFLQGRMSAAGQ